MFAKVVVTRVNSLRRMMVELVGLEPTTSSLRTMRYTKKPQFGVHLAANYGPKRSNSDRLAWGLPHNFPVRRENTLTSDDYH